MNPGVNFGAELPHKTNLRLNSSATSGSPVVHVANPPRPSSHAGAQLPPHVHRPSSRISSRASTSNGDRPACASPTGSRTDDARPSNSWVPRSDTRSDACASDGVGGGEPVAPSTIRRCRPRAATAAGRQRRRPAAWPAAPWQPVRLPASIFRSWLHPQFQIEATGRTPRRFSPPHIKLCMGHLNDEATCGSGTVHFKRFGRICGGCRAQLPA